MLYYKRSVFIVLALLAFAGAQPPPRFFPRTSENATPAGGATALRARSPLEELVLSNNASVVRVLRLALSCRARPNVPLLQALLSSGVLKACYSATGAGNNPRDPNLGVTGSAYHRLSPHAYTDGIQAMPRTGINSRNLSNSLQASGCVDIPNRKCASDMLWVFGQFLAHGNPSSSLCVTQ
jgi:hypothetical protein